MKHFSHFSMGQARSLRALSRALSRDVESRVPRPVNDLDASLESSTFPSKLGGGVPIFVTSDIILYYYRSLRC